VSEGLGFHSLRHSYSSWLDTTGATPGVTRDPIGFVGVVGAHAVKGRQSLAESRRQCSDAGAESRSGSGGSKIFAAARPGIESHSHGVPAFLTVLEGLITI
jgi:hypothetical protein